MGAEVIQVIYTDLLLRGAGIEGDVFRRIQQWWSLEGELLWEIDPCPATPPASEPER